MCESCCANLALMIAVPVPRLLRQPCRLSCRLNAFNQWSMIRSITFQMGSSSPMPRKSPPPFGMRTTIIQRSWRGISPWIQAAWTSWTKRRQWSPSPGPPPKRSGSSSWRMPRSHSLVCSALIPEAPAARPLDSLLTAVRISLSDGASLSISVLLTLIGRG